MESLASIASSTIDVKVFGDSIYPPLLESMLQGVPLLESMLQGFAEGLTEADVHPGM